MTTRLRKAFCAVVAVVLAGGLATAVPASAAEGDVGSGLEWGSCPPDPSGFPIDPRLRCATLRVPLDYREPHGRKIDIAVSKLASATPGTRRGVLFHNAGGPGGASLNLPSIYARFYPQEVLDRYDLVSFDPRGVGYSTPITCGRRLGGDIGQLPADLVFPFPAPDGSIQRNVAFAGALARDCLDKGGEVVRYVTTANTARDMDRFRIALGEPKLSYNSGSYGSYLGAVYAELFPGRVDRIVLDANVDPNRVWHRQWALWDPGAEARFPDFGRWAADRDAELGFGATPEQVRANYLALAKRLDANPVRHPTGRLLTGALFRAIYRAAQYHVLLFPQIAGWWKFAAQNGPPPPLGPVAETPGIPQDNNLAVLLAVVCGDAEWPRDAEHYQHDVDRNRPRFPVLDGMGANIWPCAFWPGPVEPPVRVTDHGPRNVLMLQTRRDPATPYEGALGMRAALGKRAVMVSVNTGNHGAYDPSTPSCATTAAHRFLALGELPSRDLSCEPDTPQARASAGLPPLLLAKLAR
ncbi:alpha/beta hydrolase [Actinokineospora auranticolor]|uniref:TAP-like protein n=1 Tax=Actinokineospora auranticolor TaxID=155976 RepID=A0A2S6GHY8_9PSEU|nr:alpha/beta hydrolase [Actinokineospora auranticolor]PPK64848.1 TAP-like protein [Actinokineospora auranticolor]